MATGETGHNVQSWTKRRAQGCKKFLPGPSWLLLSKTGPPLSPSWQLVTLHFTFNRICLSPVHVLLGLPDEEHVALLALVGGEPDGRRDQPGADQVHVVPAPQLVGVPVFHVVDNLG